MKEPAIPTYPPMPRPPLATTAPPALGREDRHAELREELKPLDEWCDEVNRIYDDHQRRVARDVVRGAVRAVFAPEAAPDSYDGEEAAEHFRACVVAGYEASGLTPPPEFLAPVTRPASGRRSRAEGTGGEGAGS